MYTGIMDVRRTFQGASSARSKQASPQAKAGGRRHASQTKRGGRPASQAKSSKKRSSAQPTQYPTPPGIEMSETFPGIVKPIAEEVVLAWVAPSRPFKKRRRQYYTTLGTIVLLLSLILFFAGQILPVAVVLAVAFLAYVLSTIPPHQVRCKITTYGVRLENQLYYWEELGRYWFDEKYGQDMVVIEVSRFPNRLTLMLGDQVSRKKIADVLSEVLLKQKPEPNIYDKVAKWLQEKVPLDIEGQ